jgi:hypothetical protein
MPENTISGSSFEGVLFIGLGRQVLSKMLARERIFTQLAKAMYL